MTPGERAAGLPAMRPAFRALRHTDGIGEREPGPFKKARKRRNPDYGTAPPRLLSDY